ncbi:hypothetical protein ACHAWF_003467 [Thalassiosira exigua]
MSASPLHSTWSARSETAKENNAPTPQDLSPTTVAKRRTPAKDAVAGACAGAIAKTAVAPIERVKLLMQLQFSIDEKSTKNRGTSKSTGTRKLGAWEVTRTVYREQGILAFWRGNTPNVIRQGGTSAMNFLLMDWYKHTISPLLVWSLRLPSNRDREIRQKRRSFLSSFLSGGLAGGTVTTVLYPIEFVRTRLAMDIGRGTADAPRLYPGGTRDVCLSIWRADGWRGLYQGYGIALAGVVLYRALHLGGYDAVKTEILHRRGHQVSLGDFHITNENNLQSNYPKTGSPPNLTMGERFLAAQIVSIIAGTACYPIDSIRRRLMMQAGLPAGERLYRNSFDCLSKVISTEGARGFYLGLGPNLVRSFGAALLLVSYDVFKVKI